MKIHFQYTDKVCGEDCELKVHIRNKPFEDQKRDLDTIKASRIEGYSSGTWQVTIKPSDYGIGLNEKVYFVIELRGGKRLNDRYTLPDGKSFSFTYQFDPIFYIVGFLVLAVVVLILIIYRFKPLWILGVLRLVSLSKLSHSVDDSKIKLVLQFLGVLAVFPFLARRPRVLNAWLEKNRRVFTNEFETNAVVKRLNYHPLPINNVTYTETWDRPSKNNITSLLNAGINVIEITGDGGSGKSSFAAQIGSWAMNFSLSKHPMLPLWLDEDIEDNYTIKSWLLNKVRILAEDESLPASFIQALFSHRRLFLIADRMSEHSASTRSTLIDKPNYLKLMIITSRKPLKPERLKAVHLKTVALDSEHLMGYLDSLINQQAKSSSYLNSLKNKAELVKEIASLITINNSNGEEQIVPITPILAKLFVKKVIEKNGFDNVPTSIVDIYVDYLLDVNPKDTKVENYLTDSQLLKSAKIIAQAELTDNFQPRKVEEQALDEKLEQAGLLNNGADPVQRLIDNQVLDKVRYGSFFLGFSLDPVAEYIGALAHAEECGKDITAWNELIAKANEFGDDAKGFMVALRVAHSAYGKARDWPMVEWPDLQLANA